MVNYDRGKRAAARLEGGEGGREREEEWAPPLFSLSFFFLLSPAARSFRHIEQVRWITHGKSNVAEW